MCLLVWEIFRVSLLKTVLLLFTDQATWFSSGGFTDYIFSCEFHVALPEMDLLKIFDKTIGGWM